MKREPLVARRLLARKGYVDGLGRDHKSFRVEPIVITRKEPAPKRAEKKTHVMVLDK